MFSSQGPRAILGLIAALVLISSLGSAVLAWHELMVSEEPAVQDRGASSPKPIPQTREEMKKLLNDLKGRKSRLPLPKIDPTDAANIINGRLIVNNGLARRTYLPAAWFAADFGNDPAMTLTYVFKTQCFWVVSRGNNCHYCLGHQEHKLHDSGLSDKQIAWLDYDWSKLDPMVRKGATISKLMTLTPHKITARDIEQLRPELSDPQIIELVYTIAMFNSVNRWTDALGIPQDEIMREKRIDFLTPVDEEFQGKNGGLSAVDPKAEDRKLPSFQELLVMMKRGEKRVPRVALPSEEAARKILGITDPNMPVAHWERALATFPEVGKKQWDALESMRTEGHVPEKLKAIIAWVSARRNMATTSLSLAYQRLTRLGMMESDIERLDQSQGLTASEDRVARFAQKLTEHPQRISDADIEQLRADFSDKQVAEIVYLIGAANMFDRFTETLEL
jgi:alkylhydroperoxidase family enzyme